MNTKQPITILVCALGGEGGGVLTQWIIDAARMAGYPAQATSIPGVAQRTGATTYYLEIFPYQVNNASGSNVVFSLNPLPGNIDLLISSELLETARQISSGYSSKDKTTVVTSTARVLTNSEKMNLADGRTDSKQLMKLIQELSKESIFFDMSRLSGEAMTIVSAVMLGAVAAYENLKIPYEVYKNVIGNKERSQQASLKGFELGFNACQNQRSQTTYLNSLFNKDSIDSSKSDSAGYISGAVFEENIKVFPIELQPILIEACTRVNDYQDKDYARLFLSRVKSIFEIEKQKVEGNYFATVQFIKNLTIWMCFEDLIEVASKKNSIKRFERISNESKLNSDQVIKIYDYFKPGLNELAGLLPSKLASMLLHWESKRLLSGKSEFSFPIKLATHSIVGILVLKFLTSLKCFRKKSSRYIAEQELIEEWVFVVKQCLMDSLELGHEVVLCAGLIKGYGGTYDRSRKTFLHLLNEIAINSKISDTATRIEVLKVARTAASRDDSGHELNLNLKKFGLTPREPNAQRIQWIPKSDWAKNRS